MTHNSQSSQPSQPSQPTQQPQHGRTVLRLAGIVVGMFAFGFALVPLYDLLCEVTGLNGKTGGPYEYDAAALQPDRSRLIKVNFITNTNEGMPWEFRSEKGGVRVHPGELKSVNFVVRNPTDRVMVAQAVPSLVPFSATKFFHKTECFCFERQELQPGEEMIMPMRFIVGRELPKTVQSIALSYSLYDITDMARIESAEEQRPGPNLDSDSVEPING
ncbi:MAG: cytochrome c oxidase assembly protein [Pseudomonadota bacterium]